MKYIFQKIEKIESVNCDLVLIFNTLRDIIKHPDVFDGYFIIELGEYLKTQLKAMIHTFQNNPNSSVRWSDLINDLHWENALAILDDNEDTRDISSNIRMILKQTGKAPTLQEFTSKFD